jgi:hypothetical protein
MVVYVVHVWFAALILPCLLRQLSPAAMVSEPCCYLCLLLKVYYASSWAIAARTSCASGVEAPKIADLVGVAPGFLLSGSSLIWTFHTTSPDARGELLLLITGHESYGQELWPVHGTTMKVSGSSRHVRLCPHHAVS